jgi:hypothetical protein
MTKQSQIGFLRAKSLKKTDNSKNRIKNGNIFEIIPKISPKQENI